MPKPKAKGTSPRAAETDDPGLPPVAIVISRYNRTVTDALLDGAKSAYEARGGRGRDLTILDAPGAFELPVLALNAASTERFAGVVALGCVIKGETSHDHYISSAVAHGLTHIGVTTGFPCAFGVLTVDTPEQALDRAGGKHGNKGEEAMHALLDTVHQIARLHGSEHLEQATRPIPDKTRTSRPSSSQGKR